MQEGYFARSSVFWAVANVSFVTGERCPKVIQTGFRHGSGGHLPLGADNLGADNVGLPPGNNQLPGRHQHVEVCLHNGQRDGVSDDAEFLLTGLPGQIDLPDGIAEREAVEHRCRSR